MCLTFGDQGSAYKVVLRDEGGSLAKAWEHTGMSLLDGSSGALMKMFVPLNVHAFGDDQVCDTAIHFLMKKHWGVDVARVAEEYASHASCFYALLESALSRWYTVRHEISGEMYVSGGGYDIQGIWNAWKLRT